MKPHIFQLVVTLLLAMSFWLGSCKKVASKMNSEKDFVLYIIDTNFVPIDTCFDKVYGAGNSTIDACTHGAQGIHLPLNIAIDSTSFYLIKNKDTSTIILRYKRVVDQSSEAFQVRFDSLKIKTSFKKVHRKCIENLTKECHQNEANYSAAIIY